MAIIKDGKKYRTLEEQVYYLTHFKDEVYTKSETDALVNEKDKLLKEEINSNVYNKNQVYTKQETNSLVDEKDSLVKNEIKESNYTKQETNALIQQNNVSIKNEIKETVYTKDEVNALIREEISKAGGKTLIYQGELDLSSTKTYPSLDLRGYDTYFMEAKIKQSDQSSPVLFAKGYGYDTTIFNDIDSDMKITYTAFMLTSMKHESSYQSILIAPRFAKTEKISTSESLGTDFGMDSSGAPYITILEADNVTYGYRDLIITKIYGIK